MIKPLTREEIDPELHGLFDKLEEKFGNVPAIFGTMARRPGAVQGMVSINTAVMEEGKVEARYREFAYLKTSLVNGCVY